MGVLMESQRGSRRRTRLCKYHSHSRLKNRLVRALTQELRLRLLEIARVLVRFDHVASVIVNANHSIVSAAAAFSKGRVINWRNSLNSCDMRRYIFLGCGLD